MSAKVIVGRQSIEPWTVPGLHDGTVLFSIYFGVVVDDWRSKCSTGEVEFKYKHDQKLVGDSTAKSHLLSDVIIELQFGDDAALYAASAGRFVSMI